MIDAATLARSGEGAKAGPIGLAVVLLLCIACYFLFKSMSKHMREVRENFPVDAPPPSARVDPIDLTRAETIRITTERETPGIAAPPPDDPTADPDPLR